MKLTTFSALLVGSLSAQGVLGWGAAGHEIVATIAQIHLHPSVLPKICEILNYTSTNPNEPQCHLAPISTWADRYKYKMRWSAALHYVGAVDDHPSKTCAFPGDHGWSGRTNNNVLGGIHNTTYLLEQFVDGGNSQVHVADEALRFLVHFIGDLHMPLHLTGRDRGGNSVKVLFDGRQTNLHSLWDGLLIAKTLRSVPRKYDRPLPIPQVEYNLRGAIYDSWIRQIMVEGILSDWRDELPEWLSCPAPDTAEDAKPEVSLTLSSALSYTLNVVFSTWNYLTSPSIPEVEDTEVLCPQHWAKPIHQLNCDLVWPAALDEPPYYNRASRAFDAISSAVDACVHTDGDDKRHSCASPEEELAMFDRDGHFVGGEADITGRSPRRGGPSPYLELDTPEYTGVIAKERILEKLMAQAGIRLAGVLNWLFEEGQTEEMMLKRAKMLDVYFK
ncbi:phospholipase C/P1 nuclease [Dendrothele bispora CBS 962.96]|uniref:Phospholipase C/P1 nuclease n=1 Tax=Dendrothele bispora (strain CBS 962.96) TaxID=1314807 RepID=A0A4S8LK90_DENBC|nr:phospholipase C/P1 nuclease [Dendrothele bispora CBS 962.96]